MHVENDLVEFGTADDLEYKEIFVPEEFQELPVTDTNDLVPTQGKSWYTTHIFIIIIYIYICGAFTLQDCVVALLRFIGSVGNLSLLTISDYYYYHKSQNEMVKRK
jgi:hypothetical protein